MQSFPGIALLPPTLELSHVLCNEQHLFGNAWLRSFISQYEMTFSRSLIIADFCFISGIGPD